MRWQISRHRVCVCVSESRFCPTVRSPPLCGNFSITENTQVEVSDAAWRRIKRGRERLMQAIEGGKVVYGVNTGFGSCANIVIPPSQMKQLQVNLIRSHAAGKQTHTHVESK